MAKFQHERRLKNGKSGEKIKSAERQNRRKSMKHYTTPRLDAIVFNESDAVRTSGTSAASEKGFGDIFAEVTSNNPEQD